MGLYINQSADGLPLPPVGKADTLLKDSGCREITEPDTFVDNLVCVVENGSFDAAAYCGSFRELVAFCDSRDKRRRRWLIHPKAKELAK